MTHVFADGFSRVSLAGGVLRFTLIQSASDNQTKEVGELLIPASRAQAFVQGMATSISKLAEQLQSEQQGQNQESPAEGG